MARPAKKTAAPNTADQAESGPEETHFGFQQVPLTEKQGKVNEVFHSVAEKYDIMNDLMSAGLHRPWKNALVSWLRPPKGQTPYRHLDVAGGTGDVAFRILEAAGEGAHVTVLDINGNMLAVGQDRAEKQSFAGKIDFMEANAESLPYPDKTFEGTFYGAPIRQGRIKYRQLPVQQDLEDWNDFWSDYKGA